MKRKFIKGLSVATAICLSFSNPVAALAQESNANNNTTTVSESSSNATNSNEPQNQNDGADSTSNSLNDEEDHPYEISNSESGTEIKNDKEINTDNCGIEARNNSSVKQEGDVNTKDDAVNVTGGSKVSVDGNITATDKEGNESSITGVQVLDGEAVINGNITIDTEGKIGSESIGVKAGDIRKQNGDVNVVVNGNISATSKKTTDYHQPIVDGEDYPEGYDEELNESATSKGVDVTASKEHKTTVVVNGDITVKSDAVNDDDWGGQPATIRRNRGEASLTINGKIDSSLSGVSISDNSGAAEITVTDDVNSAGLGLRIGSNKEQAAIIVEGDVTSEGAGISVSSNEGSSTIIVKGDVTSQSSGIKIHNNSGEVNIVVDGTVKSKGTSVRYTSRIINKRGEDNRYHAVDPSETGVENITVWKLESENNKAADAMEFGYVKSDGTAGIGGHDEDYDKIRDLYDSINYIIRTKDVSNGTMKVSGTREVAGYNTALEAEVITIKVDTASGYKLDAVKNGNSVLAKNNDGTYTLVVPRGGGVELSAVISALKKIDDTKKISDNGSDNNSNSSLNNSSSNSSSNNNSASSETSNSSKSGSGSSSNSSSGSGSGSGSGSSGSGSSGSSSGFGGGSGSSPVVSNDSQSAGTTVTSESGASVAKSVSAEGNNSTTTITIGDKTANINSITTDTYGLKTTFRSINGDIAGATFKGVGTVSADGSTVTTENGETYSVTNAPILIITSSEYRGGCFVDLNTGKPIATGETEVYYQLGEDGQLHAHWVDPNGFFYNGICYVNGQYCDFNNEGVLERIINIETN